RGIGDLRLVLSAPAGQPAQDSRRQVPASGKFHRPELPPAWPFTTRALWNRRATPTGPIFLNFLLVLTATRSAGGVNHWGNSDRGAAPWDAGRSDGYLIRRRTSQDRSLRGRGARPARAGVLAGAPVRRRAARQRRGARTPAAARRDRSGQRGRPP